MAVLTLAEAKEDLGVVGTEDDARIQALLDAAIESAAGYIKRTIPWNDDAGAPVDVPSAVNAAIRLELRALYDNPEDVQSAAFKALLQPHRDYA